METLLKNHTDLANNILFTLPVGVVFQDQDGKFLSANKLACDIFRYDCASFEGKTLSDLNLIMVREDFSEFPISDFPALQALQNARPVEKTILGILNEKGDDYTWIQIDSFPQFKEGSDIPYRVYSVLQDITGLYNSRNLLQQSEESYKTLVDNMHSAMMILQDDKIVFGNKILEKKSGFKLEKLIGTPFINYVHPDDRKRVLDNYASRVKGKKAPESYRSRTLNINGSYIHVDVKVKAIKYQNKPAVMVVMNDIDAEVRSGEALIRREERLRTIYDTVGNIIFELLPDDRGNMRFSSVNEEFYRVTGFSYEEVIGKEVTNIFNGGSSDIFRTNCSRAISEMQTIRWEDTTIFPRNTMTGSFSLSPVFDDNGKCIQLVGAIHDISARKKAEKKIIESESKFRSMFQQNIAVMLLIDGADGNIIDANDSAVDFYMYSREELLGLKISDINSYSKEEFEHKVKEIISQGSIRLQLKHTLKNGTKRDVEVFSTSFVINEKDVIYSIIFDVTDKLRYEKDLILFSTAIEQSPESLIIADREGLIKYINPMFTRSTGYPGDEVIGKNLRDFLEARNDLSLYDRLWTTVNSGKNWYGEMETARKNGELIWENVSVSPISGTDGVITHFIIVRKDITEELRIRENLVLAKEKAEESDRLKSTFLATMSHELRTPLNAVLGFSDVIRDKTDDEDIARFADIIFKSGKGLLDIIEDIFDLARIERDRIIIRSQQVEVRDLFQEISKVLQEDLKSTNKQENIKTVFQSEDNLLDMYITTDKSKIIQVMTNLIKNAVKYTEKGSIEIGLYDTMCGELALYVKDTGIGIPKDKQEVIFEFFRQGDDSHTRKYGGLGIGLAISNRIAHALSARIEIESEPGVGSVFKFFVPGLQIDQDGSLISSSGQNIPDFTGKEILAVEDDPTNMIYLEELISLTGAKFIRIFNGKEAIDYLSLRNRPDVILMDLKMPVMDGFEASRIIRSRFNDLPIIALTAYAYKNDRERAMNSGCREVLVKPVNRQELFNVLSVLFTS